MFADTEKYIKCCNTITDDEVLEALDALNVARSLFEFKELTTIPDRIYICNANGQVIHTNSYNCIPTPWYKGNLFLGVMIIIATGLSM